MANAIGGGVDNSSANPLANQVEKYRDAQDKLKLATDKHSAAVQKAGAEGVALDQKSASKVERTVNPLDWANSAKVALNDSLYGIKPPITSNKTEDSEFSTPGEYSAQANQPGQQQTPQAPVMNMEQWQAMGNNVLTAQLSGTPNLSVKVKEATLSSPSVGDVSDQKQALKSVGVVEEKSVEPETEKTKTVNPYEDMIANEVKRAQFESAKIQASQHLFEQAQVT